MRKNFIICLLLVSAVQAKPSSKISLGVINSIFEDKLFGSNKVVIAQPVLTNNETYQLFKIPGLNDIVIKLSRKDKLKDEATPEDAVVVKPEVAIIGPSETTTQKETLLAIDTVNSLINSGIWNGRRNSAIQELVVPFVPQPLRFNNLEKQNGHEKGHMLVPMGMHEVTTPIQSPHLQYFEDQPVPLNVYEEGNMFVPIGMQEVVKPVHAQYSYEQKGPDAGMTYKTYDGKDVFVTRTEKEPPLCTPQHTNMGIAEVATIGAYPYAVKQPLSMNGAPIPYYVKLDPMTEFKQPPIPLSYRIPLPLRNRPAEYFGSNAYENPTIVDRNPIFQPGSMSVASPYYFANNMQVIKDYANEGKSKANAYKIAVGEFLKNHYVNGQILPQYVNKNMDGQRHENYTEVKIKEHPQPKGIEAVGSNKVSGKDYVFIPPKGVQASMLSLVQDNSKINEESPQSKGIELEGKKHLSKDYVYIPPKGVQSSMLSVISPSNKPDNSKGAEQDNENALNSKISSNEVNRKQYVPSLKLLNTENRNKYSIQENFKTSEAIIKKEENKKRGDIPGATA